MSENNERKTSGIRLDVGLTKQLKIEAINEDLSYEELVNRVLWDYAEKQKSLAKMRLEKEIKKQNKADKKEEIK